MLEFAAWDMARGLSSVAMESDRRKFAMMRKVKLYWASDVDLRRPNFGTW
jgi:hypothetical protein